MKQSLFILLALLAAPSISHSQSAASANKPDSSRIRLARAARRTGNITLDGKLDEPAWQAAPVIDDFSQSYPKQGAKATDRTEARVLYDDAAVYVGIRMYDSHPDSIVAQLARRDALGIYSDWIHVVIDSYHDRRTAFRFTTNPRGVKKDVYTSNDSNEDTNWDAVWEVATRVDSLGWVAEYRIPLSQLRFGGAAPGQDRVWGLQIVRDIARRNERDSWSPWTPQSPGFVSLFGDLAGLRDIPDRQRLEALPYVSTRLTRAPVELSNPFSKPNQFKLAGGADLRYGLPGALTLTATLNPDFGQVEVDPSVVNLSAFETFFPEKRPFFLEGSDVLNFGSTTLYNDYGFVNYFYSRRIGRQPHLTAGGPGVLFADQPEQATIAGAAKITGKAGPWTVGLLEALTPEAQARILTASGISNSPVEPLTNYFAGRLKRDFRDGATVVGAMVTSTARDMSDTVFKPLLRSNATFAGVDFEQDMQQKNWILSGYFAGTLVEGSRDAIAQTQLNSTHYYQRPDISYVHFDSTRNSLAGNTGEIALAKQGSWYGSLAYKEMSPGFEVNDIGFVGRADVQALSAYYGYQDYQQGKHFTQFGNAAYADEVWNFGGTSTFREVADTAFSTLNNFWQANGTAVWFPEYFDDRFTRGGPVGLSPAGGNISVNLISDTRKPVSINFNPSYAWNKAGGGTVGYSLTADTSRRATSTSYSAPVTLWVTSPDSTCAASPTRWRPALTERATSLPISISRLSRSTPASSGHSRRT
ncbi:MAG: DUF5916 domain-containing protein [Gemmatimonadaceae bacterium]